VQKEEEIKRRLEELRQANFEITTLKNKVNELGTKLQKAENDAKKPDSAPMQKPAPSKDENYAAMQVQKLTGELRRFEEQLKKFRR
jgi:DNA repair exonuclease SbcCD ATPase subunit